MKDDYIIHTDDLHQIINCITIVANALPKGNTTIPILEALEGRVRAEMAMRVEEEDLSEFFINEIKRLGITLGNN